MANIDLASITDPISDDQPCGPDLDMEFDGDFMNFEANVGMAWPERYFSWDSDALKGHTFYDQIEELLSRSRDLRMLVPLAKLRILEGDLSGFAEALSAIQRLLKEHWADVHPQPADFLELGMGQLSTLDDNQAVSCRSSIPGWSPPGARARSPTGNGRSPRVTSIRARKRIAMTPAR